ncbi:MAG TPA: PilZ domain-containing protein [Bryobacteraceae bacterium]|jgi:hypothetical protein|nr:PilZ domain-containing protein [Bryobacteraceae bacterium]
MTDRRQSSRFPIGREVRYKTINQRSEVFAGVGKTLNISSSGVLFTSDHELPLGTRIEVSISWPAQLNEKCLLNLVARGRVTRYLKGQLAVQIQQYEFKTQSRTNTVSAQSSGSHHSPDEERSKSNDSRQKQS